MARAGADAAGALEMPRGWGQTVRAAPRPKRHGARAQA